MKKFAAFITISVILFCLTVLTACNVNTDTLSNPTNLRYETGKQEIVWNEVPFATGGYIFEINGESKQIGRDYWYSLADLKTGTYTIRVKALTIDNKYFQDSDWSKPYIHVVRRESGVTYRLINDGSEYEIESIGEAKGDIVIFDKYLDGKPITSVGDGAFADTKYNSVITSVVLGENIKNIGKNAFNGCQNLNRITLPEGLLTIGDYAFRNCKGLLEINLPDNLIKIGESTFANCTVLKSIKIPDRIQTLPASLFTSCIGLTDVTIGKGVRSIQSYAFNRCTSLTKITIPGNVEKILENALSSTGLVEVVLEEGVARISESAFTNSASLEKISIPSTVTKIGANAFYATKISTAPGEYADPQNPTLIYADNWVVGSTDKKVLALEVKEGTVGIGDYTFNSHENLAEVKLPETIKHIGTYAFNGTAIWKNAEEDIVYVGNWVVGCKSPETITRAILPQDTVGIASHAFAACLLLTSVEGASEIISIGEYAFYYCVELRFTIFSKVQYIGDYAFYNCQKLGNQNIPSGVQRIGDYTFYSNGTIKNIGLPETLKSIGHSAFRFTDLDQINIPDSVTHLGDYAFGSIATNYDGIRLDVVLPAGITYVGEQAFAWSSKITSVTMNSVEYIGEKAFYRCASMSEVKFNDGLKYIANDAFSSTALINVVLPDTLTYLGDMVFAGEWGFTSSNLESIVIPNGITRIGRYSFYECRKLTRIAIPESVTSIGDYAFTNCDNLKSVVLGKNVLGLGHNVFFGCKNLSIFCESTIRPAGWSIFWNSRDYITPEDFANPPEDLIDWGLGNKDEPMCPIIWGCTLSEDKSYVISFTRHGFSIYNYNNVDFSAPVRVGYTFIGWSLISDSTEADYNLRTFQLSVSAGGPSFGSLLYAVWIQQEG